MNSKKQLQRKRALEQIENFMSRPLNDLDKVTAVLIYNELRSIYFSEGYDVLMVAIGDPNSPYNTELGSAVWNYAMSVFAGEGRDFLKIQAS